MSALTIGNSWALRIAEEVRNVGTRCGYEWISAADYAHAYRFSRAQANHILGRAVAEVAS